jgi:hypothetical protein
MADLHQLHATTKRSVLHIREGIERLEAMQVRAVSLAAARLLPAAAVMHGVACAAGWGTPG